MRSFARPVALVIVCLFCIQPLFAIRQIGYVEVGPQPVDIAVDSTRHLAYSVDEIDGTVAVIDTNTHALITTIAGNPADGVALNPNTNLIYVNTGNVEVIDGATRTIVANIVKGFGTGGIGVDPTLNKIYAVNGYDDSLSVIDGATNTVIDTLPVGHDPVRVAVDTATHDAYVSNGLSGTVSVVDGQTDTVVSTITLPGAFPFPNGLAVDSSLHRLYVTDNNNFFLDVIDTRTFTVTSSASGFSSPHAVSVNSSTHGIFVLDFALQKTIHAVNPSTFRVTASVGRPLPLASAVEPNTGYLYVCASTRVVILGP